MTRPVLKEGLEGRNLKFIKQYNDWITHRPVLARQLEHVLQLVPMFLPKSMDSDASREGLYGIAGLMKLYHDYVLAVAENSALLGQMRVPRVVLTILAHLQVPIEAFARSRSADTRNTILSIELIKALMKLLILQSRKKEILVHGGQYFSIQEEVEVGPSSNQKYRSRQRNSRDYKTSLRVTFEGETITTEKETTKQKVGELLHILRPVVYTLMKRRTRESSWTPISCSFLMEIIGLYCSFTGAKPMAKDKERHKQEFARRKFALFFYLLRNPILQRFTQPALLKICDATDSIPLLGRIARMIIRDWILYYSQFHFYTSASS